MDKLRKRYCKCRLVEKIKKELDNRRYLKLSMIWIKAHQLDKLKKGDKEGREQLLNDPHIVGNAMADILADHKRHENKLKTDK